jgi:hypothetical protein
LLVGTPPIFLFNCGDIEDPENQNGNTSGNGGNQGGGSSHNDDDDIITD